MFEGNASTKEKRKKSVADIFFMNNSIFLMLIKKFKRVTEKNKKLKQQLVLHALFGIQKSENIKIAMNFSQCPSS